jgi:uncharacterized protein YndB with AHSA1/START domain
MIDDGKTDGEVTRSGAEAVIRFERHLLAEPAVVWVALTDPAFLSRWWGEATIDPRVGGQFDVCWFNPTPSGDRLTMHGVITEFTPPHVLESAGDVHGILRWELTDDGATGTNLVFTSTLDLPEEFRSRTLAGWHYHLMALGDALTGGRADLVELPGWAAINQRYQDRDG